MRIGSLVVQNIKIGTQEVRKVMVGPQLVWERTIVDTPQEFISTWNVLDSGVTGAMIFFDLPFSQQDSHDVIIDWGDGTEPSIFQLTANPQFPTTPSHSYDVGGQYVITITGTFGGFSPSEFGGFLDGLLEIHQWGCYRVSSGGNDFKDAIQLNLSNVSDVLNLTGTTELFSLFMGCTSLTTINRINEWDTSNITNMSAMFFNATSFNQSLNNWNTSSVLYMDSMFEGATAFNGSISGWNVSNVLYFDYMFDSATTFNQPLNSWNTSSALSLMNMFYGATAFNQPLNNWNTSNVTNMNGLFAYATNFNGDISNWVTTNVTQIAMIFYQANSFNQPIGGWDVSNVTSMSNMFENAYVFNQDISTWNVSNVTSMSYTFYNAHAFDQNLGSWNVSKVTLFNSFMGTKTPERLSQVNLDAIYNGWSQLVTLSPDKSISFGTAKYSPNGQAGRNILTGTHGWVITDGGVAENPNTFISLWDTSYISTGSSTDMQVKLPLESTGTYNFSVDWGDGTQSTITAWNQPEVTHTYATFAGAGRTIKISGTCIGWSFNNTGDKRKILNITQWGNLKLGNSGSNFYGCVSLNLGNVSDVLNLTGTTNLHQMFRDCSLLNTINRVNEWDMSGVTTIRAMFQDAWNFNGDLNNWNLASLAPGAFMDNSGLSHVFNGATAFNGDISTWNTSNVTQMNSMFRMASSFNQDISGWDVSNVVNMEFMFEGATAFDQNIGSWNVSKVSAFAFFMSGKAPTTLSSVNLGAIYNGWSQLPTLTSWNIITFGTAKYTPDSQAGRDFLSMNYGWDITDGGMGEPPLAPGEPTGLNVTSLSKTTLTLNWVAPVVSATTGTAETYRVERKLTSGSTWTVVTASTANLNTPVTGLTQNTQYDFRVSATNVYGTSAFSAVYTVTTQNLLIMVPSADVTVSDWTVAPLWSKVNTPNSSATFISSSNANGSTCRLRFTVPTASGPGILKLYRRKTTGNDPSFIWTLYRNGTQVDTNSLTLTSTTFIQTDTPLAQDIVSGATYEIVLTRSGGGSPSARGILDMAALWIEY